MENHNLKVEPDESGAMFWGVSRAIAGRIRHILCPRRELMHGETSCVFCDHHGHRTRIARNEADVEAFKMVHSRELTSSRTWKKQTDSAFTRCMIAIKVELRYHVRASDVMRPAEIWPVSVHSDACRSM